MNKVIENKKNSYRHYPAISDGYNRIVKQTDENTWVIIDNESEKVIGTITKDIVTTHGGKISLEDSRLGGLRVVIELPL